MTDCATCTSCLVLRFELSALKTEMGVKNEELLILRGSQKECARMAAEIADLQTLAEEQRRHMAFVSDKDVDPDVGIYTWLKQQSDRHALSLNELKGQKDHELYSLRTTHMYEMAQLQQQMLALTATNEGLAEQHRQMLESMRTTTEQLQMLEATVQEQRRYLGTLAAVSDAVDVEVALLPLVKKGYIESSDAVRTYVKHCLTAKTDELNAALRDLEAAKATVEEKTAELNSVKASVDELQAGKNQAAEENLVLISQLRRSNDFTLEWKRKYEEKSMELEAFTLALAEQKTMEAHAQQLADLIAEKQEWAVEQEKLNKMCAAYLTSVRHWQKEAQRVTDDLVTALSSRDNFQLRLYTVTAEKQVVSDEADRLRSIVESQKKACAFVADVGHLWGEYCKSKLGDNPALDEECLQGEVVVEAKKSKKGKKSRGKK